MKKTCEVCKNKLFQYVCPSCEIVYCSLECYKKHNEQCVNRFLENQVNEEIKNNVVTEFDKKEFTFKLRNFYEQNISNDFVNEFSGRAIEHNKEEQEIPYEEEEEEEEKIPNEEEEHEEEDENEDNDENQENPLKKWCISKKRYKVLFDLAKKDSLQLENLNDIEKKQFFSFLKSKDLSTYIKNDYEPWWLNCVIKKMTIPEHICCRKIVNESIIYIIIEIIYSYCYIMRIHMGNIRNKDFCYALLYLASSLDRFSFPPISILNTLQGLFERIREYEDFPSDQVVLYNILLDVTKILSLKELILRCLNESNHIFKREIHKQRKSESRKGKVPTQKTLYTYVYKKIHFLYSYSFYHYEKFESLSNEIVRFYEQNQKIQNSDKPKEIVLSKDIR